MSKGGSFLKKKYNKKKRNDSRYVSIKRLSLCTCFIVVIVCFSFGLYQTYAALTDSDKKQNEFRLGDFQTSIEEEFDPPASFNPDKEYMKKVTIKNTGEQASFIRVLALPIMTKKQASGTTILLPATTDGATPILTIDYNLSDWIDGQDGYFYFKKTVGKNERTTQLFSKVKMNKANITEEYTDANLSFEIKAEGISTTKFAYRDAWWKGQIPTSGVYLEIDQLLKEEAIDE